jgi:carotenoid cleavage dioxygenase-like enzyme
MIPDPAAKRVYSFSTRGVPIFGCYRLWYVEGASRTRTVWATVKDRRPSWMHAFGLSEHYAVLTAFPLRCNTWQLFFNALIGKPFIRTFQWHGDEPTKGYLIERSSGRVVRTFDLPPLFAFHFANTWEEDGAVVFDLAAYDDASAIDAGRLDTVFGPEGGRFPLSTLQRVRVPVDGGEVEHRVLSDAPIEMPRFNEALSMRPYRFVYGFSYDEPGRFYNQLVKIDTQQTGANDVRWGPPGSFPSEPVFIPRPGATAEDDGVVLSVVLDVDGQQPSSSLVVLDAATFTELGRARVPHHIPFGLHGSFVPTTGGTA